MRVYFIKDFDDRPYGLLHKAGTDAIMWDTTAIRALAEKCAVKYEERIIRKKDDESQTEQAAMQEGPAETRGLKAKGAAAKKKKTKN